MGALDQVKSYFTGDVKIDDPEIRHALNQAFKGLAKAGSEFDDLEYLPKEYIQEKIVPALMVMDEASLQAFKSATEKTSSDLHSLTKDIESSLRYKPRDGRAVPGNQQIPDRIKSSAKSVFKDAQDFITEMANLRTDAEKEQALMAEIIASANRSVVKFDQYVTKGDGKQYGNKANDWFEIDSMNTEIRRPANSKKIKHNVENVPKIDFVTVVNDVVAMAQEPSPNVNIEGKMQPVGGGTRIDKLAYLASWMSALEEGTDKVLPNMLAEATTNATVKIVNAGVDTVSDVGGGLFDEYPVATTAGIALAVYASYKAGKGILALGSIPLKGMAWAAGKFGVTRGLVPGLTGAGTFLENFGRHSSSGAPGSPTEGPKTPSRFVEVNPAELKDFKPGEANHEEYYKKTVEKIKSLGVAPAAPAAGAVAPPPAITPAEVTKRKSLFMGLDKEYRGGKISLAEYLKRTEDILAGRGRVLVVDHAGTVNGAESVKNVKQRIADRTPVVSQFTKNNPNGSAALSVNAIQAAKNRIKGTAYESVDIEGNVVKFENSASKVLYEEIRDELKTYRNMQEWGQTNTEITNRGTRVLQLDADIVSKDIAITGQEAVMGRYPSTIPNPGGVHLGHIPNPDPAYRRELSKLENLNAERGRLDAERQLVKTEASNLAGKKIAEFKQVNMPDGSIRTVAIPGDPLGYGPAGNSHAQFVIDINNQKLKISSPGVSTGLIQRINFTLPVDSKIPESFFDRKMKLLNIIKFLDVIKISLAK